MRVVITGATGYIGTRLTSLALKRGHDVVMASRKRPENNSAPWISFDLSSENSIMLPDGTNVVVHLAANTGSKSCLDEKCEVAAALKLITLTHEAGARFIFVSSQTARVDAPSVYGRTKWKIEQAVLSAGGWVVRPGQVFGGELRGQFGMLVNTVRQLPVLPVFVPAPKVQPIHVDDLALGLLRIAEGSDVPLGVYCLAAPEPVTFTSFLVAIAQLRLRCRRVYIPVPAVAISALIPVLGKTLRVRLGLERLRSLFDLPIMETAADLKQLGLTLRPLHSGMHPSGSDRRRQLLREGQALLVYVLEERPGGALLRHYVRAIESLRGGQALSLARLLLNVTVLLSVLDESIWADKKMGAEFMWRLDAATVLAEATPTGAYHFLGLGREHSVLRSLLSITNALALEVLWRVLRRLMFPLVRHALGPAKKGSV
jgi:NADH dehydrogenase